MRIPLIAGNWKMFKTKAEADAFADKFKKLYSGTDVGAVICGPYTVLDTLVDAFKASDVKVGAQNVHYEDEGAFTGEISVPMLEEIGVDFCIVGHSERRAYFGETDETVNLKVKRLLSSTIRPIVCVGETLDERDRGHEKNIVENQIEGAMKGVAAADMEKIVIAYEPVWAIGTGRTATPDQAGEMCGVIRQKLIDMYDEDTADKVIIQYGGSVKPDNASDIMEMDEIDGALVGGASLKAENFMEIIDF